MTPLYKACWLLWLGGTVLIVLSWVDVVTPAVGWVGFGVALVAALLSLAAPKQAPRPPQASEEPTDAPPT
jgi:hypothetical protein